MSDQLSVTILATWNICLLPPPPRRHHAGRLEIHLLLRLTNSGPQFLLTVFLPRRLATPVAIVAKLIFAACHADQL